MEENFSITWDTTTDVQNEEVICNMVENEILPSESEEFTGVSNEEIIEETTVTTTDNDIVQQQEENDQQDNIVYFTDGNVLVMQPSTSSTSHNNTVTTTFPDQIMECQEEIVTDEQWVNEQCPEEIVIGAEEAVIGSEDQINEDFDIPLPTDQDEYTAARPYPCDFCSRRFRKKANLINHMVAHQTDRPHGCNLCGVRYIRKSDLMNHLKIHAFSPETHDFDDDETGLFDESSDIEKFKRTRPSTNKRSNRRTSNRVKEESSYDSYDDNHAFASSSKSAYNYVDEDMRLMEAMENNNVKSDYADYLEPPTMEVRYPITDPRKPFVCQHCGVGFAREKALASHARVHGGDSPFECQKCGEMFWDVAALGEHARTKHGNMEDYDLEDDDDNDADYSEEDTRYGTFYCSTCGLSFHRQDNLRRHQRIHIKDEYVNHENEFGHVCNVCGESFMEALDLLAHAEVHARGNNSGVGSSGSGIGSEFRCLICGELCDDETLVAEHVQIKHGKNLPPNTCMLCGRTCKDRRTLLKHSWEHSKEKLFACSKCAKTFHNKARLKRHMLSHRNKIVTCDVCNEEFPDGRSLMNHRHSHSSISGRQFPCRECGKTFGSRSSQQIHIRIHTGERPYGCRFCWKAFADGGTLRKHERIHTGEKPYACAVCPRAFNQRVVLREHIRSHHSGPDPKYTHSVTPYCCQVCSDMFATSQDLIVHLIHHCDLNTAMKRQPQVGPRKYKRRRKLKPHELEMISNKIESVSNIDGATTNSNINNTYNEDEDDEDDDEINEQPLTESDDDDNSVRNRRKSLRKSTKKSSPKSSTINDTSNEIYNNCRSAIERNLLTISSIVNKPTKTSKKLKNKIEPTLPSRPKMIHTQKTRIPVETGEDGKVRHKTRTLITRTQPAEIKSSTGERIRPRTKNVSYHIINSEKFPIATFPNPSNQDDDDGDENDDDTAEAVNNLLKEEHFNQQQQEEEQQTNGLEYMETDEAPEVAAEQIIETDCGPVPTNIIKVTTKQYQQGNSLAPGRHIIGPDSKVVRIVKGGMIITKNKKKSVQHNNNNQKEPESILPDIDPVVELSTVAPSSSIADAIKVKQEITDPSPLHELAELSMQHAQNKFKCEMCSKEFSDRATLLVHVPIHI